MPHLELNVVCRRLCDDVGEALSARDLRAHVEAAQRRCEGISLLAVRRGLVDAVLNPSPHCAGCDGSQNLEFKNRVEPVSADDSEHRLFDGNVVGVPPFP